MLEQIEPLLSLIGKLEGRNDYNTIWGGVAAKDYPRKLFSQMTVREVLAWQDSIDSRYKSEAAGKYQILEDTLREIMKPAGVSLDDLFNGPTQDKLALCLLRRRGLDKYLAGTITANEFGQQLSMEWASLPCTIRDKRGRYAGGQSFYAGDGLNKSGVNLEAFIATIKKIKPERVEAPIKQQPFVAPAEPAPNRNYLMNLLTGLLAAVRQTNKVR